MSKETFIGGDYIETTGGDTKIFSGESIFNASSQKVIQVGNENGVSYNSAKEFTNSNVEIEEIFWVFGDENERINDYSKHSVDLNLVVKIKNAKIGDCVRIKIKSEDGEPIAEEVNDLTLSGVVLEGNKIFFKEPFKKYTMIVMKEDNNN